MLAPGNLKFEEMRAQEMVNTLTDRKKAAILFASARSQGSHVRTQTNMGEAANVNRSNRRSIFRVFKGFRPNHSAVTQNPRDANERVSTSAC